jgi:glycosyltransferase involved in cell wall biosynthesis
MKKLLYVTNYKVSYSHGIYSCNIPADRGVMSVLGKNCEITFVGIYDEKINSKSEFFHIEAKKVVLLNISKKSALKEIITTVRNFFKIIKLVNKSDYILIKLFQPIGILSAIASILLRKKYFVLLVGDPEKSFMQRSDLMPGNATRNAVSKFIKFLTVYLIKKSDSSCFVSESLKIKYGASRASESVASESWLQSKNYNINHPSIKQYFDNNCSRNLRILFVGRIVREKGLFQLIEATHLFNSLYYPCTLTLVGEGKDLHNLQDFSSKIGIQHNVNFKGLMKNSSDELINQYKDSDVFVLPSYSEGMPLCLLEAAAAKNLIIATNVGGVSEFISNNETGIILSNNSPSAIVDALESCLLDPELTLSMIDSSYRNSIDKSFDEEQRKMYKFIINSIVLNGDKL